MAILKGSNIKLRGIFGNTVIRVMDRKVIVSARQTHYTKPTDADSIKRNDDFLFCAKLASVILKMASLSQFWSIYRKGRRIYQVILSENKLLISNGNERSNIQMVPAECIKLPVIIKEIVPFEDRIVITINPLEDRKDIDTFWEPTLVGNMLLSGTNPASKENKYLFIPVLSEYKPVQTGEEMSFSFRPIPIQLIEFNSFSERSIYMTFTTLGRNGKPVQSSQLFSWNLVDE